MAQGAISPGETSCDGCPDDLTGAERADLETYRAIFEAAFPRLPRNFTAGDVERATDTCSPDVLRRALARGRFRRGQPERVGRFVQLQLWPVAEK